MRRLAEHPLALAVVLDLDPARFLHLSLRLNSVELVVGRKVQSPGSKSAHRCLLNQLVRPGL